MKKLLYEYLNCLFLSLGRKLTVSLLGYGKTNRALGEILSECELVESVTVRQDGLSKNDIPSSFGLISKDSFSLLYEDVIIPSPSVRRERLDIPKSSHVISDYSLLFDSIPKNLFCVSGSDGKSTVTTLASLLLFPYFPDLFTGGNIGTPLALASDSANAFLLELSSFTLRYSVPLSSRAVITNVTPNHLDWHASLSEYRECKLSLIDNAREPILCLDDTVSKKKAQEIHSFCLTSDTLPDSYIKRKFKTEHTVTLEEGSLRLDGEEIIPITEIRRNEKHNLRNLASAIALSIGYADKDRIRRVAASFDGLSERCEQIVIDGIKYISSSIDTTPMRTATTLNSLGRKVSIILGGRTKQLPLEPLRLPLIKYASRISVYGEARDEFLDFLESDEELSAIPHRAFTYFSDAIDYAKENLTRGDTLLLSPAATGYGEFKSYEERGRFFKSYIQKI